MGCDIHLHTEVKIKGEWHHYGAPNVNRNYALFEKMAGVRGDLANAISPPKGIPDNCTALTRYDADRMGSDGHSHSYLNAEEIDKLQTWWEKERGLQDYPERQWGYLFGNSWGGFNKYPEDRPDGIEDVRFVFWFDC